MADNKGTYVIRNSCPYVPDYAATGGGGFNMDSVKAMLASMQPGHVAEVGQAYTAAANALSTAADRLHQHARRVAEAWSGENAQTALKQLGQLNTTAAELQEKSAATGGTYTWLGTEILPWYQNQGETMGAGLIHTGGDDDAAIELLDRMDHRLVEGYNSVPESISKDLPPLPRDAGEIGDPWLGDGRDTGITSTAGTPPSVPSVPSFSDPTSETATWHGADPGDLRDHPGSDLPGPADGGTGIPPTGGTGLPGAGGTDLAGAGGGIGPDPFGAGGLGGGAGGAAGGLGAGTGGGPGAGVLGMGAPGSGGAGRSRSAGENARGAGGRAGLGAPMGAGGGQGGKDDEERERSTWLTEDEDVWTADGDIAPPVIGDH
jgi:hypothetical protein